MNTESQKDKSINFNTLITNFASRIIFHLRQWPLIGYNFNNKQELLMKKLLHYILSYQLIFWGFPNLTYSQAMSDADIEAQKTKCEAKGEYSNNGQNNPRRWDPKLNRCVFTDNAMDTREQTRNCQNEADPEACYKRIAEEKTGVKEGEGTDKAKSGGGLGITGSAITGIYGAYFFFAKDGKSATESSCTSGTIFGVTSLAFVGGDIYLRMSAKKDFKALGEKYSKEQEVKSIDTNQTSYQAQIRAFDYLKEEQELVKKHAGQRAMLYTATEIGYGAALVMALAEAFTTWAAPCGANEQRDQDNEKMESENKDLDKEYDNEMAKDKPDHDKLDKNDDQYFKNEDNIAANTDASKALTEKIGSTSQFLQSSAGIATFSGIMLALNTPLMIGAKDQEKEAEENIATIEEIKKGFKEVYGGFCPGGREDMSDARCYCYTQDGKRNPNRTKSSLCQNLWAKEDQDFYSKGKDYKLAKKEPAQGCTTINGRFDLDCKCKKVVNTQTGKNACKQVPLNLSMGLPAIGTSHSQFLSSLNDMNQGANNALAQFGTDNAAKSAAKIRKLSEGLLDKYSSQGKIPSASQINKLTDKFIKTVPKSEIQKANADTISTLASSSRPAGEAMKEALSKATSKSKNKSAFSFSGGKGFRSKGARAGGGKFVWNDDANDSSSGKVEEFMDKKYDYKGNDIVDREDVSIWDVISNRYNTSGMRRLFGEE